MDDKPHLHLSVDERSEINLLKKTLRTLGEQIGLPTYQLAKVDIIIAELASNFLKHATAPGEVLFREIRRGTNPGIEIIGIDHGPGMHDIAHRMSDGVSTTHTLGTGIGAIRRLSDQFDIYSRPAWGTLLLSRVFKEEYAPPPTPAALAYATLMVAYPGETLCGDGLAFKRQSTTHTFLLTDGLGHGPHAHEASCQAIAAFQQARSTNPQALIATIHEHLTRTRGAVGMVLTLDLRHRTIDYCGVGNISLRKITSEESKRGISTPGIMGQTVRNRILPSQFDWSDDALLILHSDGIGVHWNLAEYPELRLREPVLWAAALYKDHKRRKDDCALLAISLKKAIS